MSEENSCNGCDICCRHIAIEIDAPETKKELEQIRWFLLHKDVIVFIDNDDSWILQANTVCTKLKDGLCSDYENRPKICRDYSSENCEKYGDGEWFKIIWRTPEEFEKWIKDGKKIPK